ncbi:uncharacterized protein C8Q71DRAFT_862464 [Rhodofomes roseus]|uniref:F-box domain-containing protein n=1 Tax=Rhodofomes roseus TaxID=34475 RepID=A0ABQ8K1V5_9APHY|nr:uncharacterized protein C8Q71DRAFT_862464 [Rhodofomes roseus]KAH9830454.1 hypothetical protein C8Q71DRAFT_862464 [Rhodofomes roseus]
MSTRSGIMIFKLQLPIEVWERVIDHLWEDYPELFACSLVCRAWRARCSFQLLSRVFLHSRADVYRLAKRLKSQHAYREQVHTLIVRGDPKEETRKPIPQLGTLAAVFAASPPYAKDMGIWHATWQSSLIPKDVFLHLTTFVAVTRLTLAHVTFPTVLTFGRLTSALPNLQTLACRDVAFEKKRFPIAFLAGPSTIVDFNMLCGTPMDEVVDFLVTTAGIAQGLEELRVAFWDPAPLLKDLKALRVKQLLQAASDSLSTFDIRFGGVDLDPAAASEAINELDLSTNSNLRDLRLTLQVLRVPPEGKPVQECTWLYTLLSRIVPEELVCLSLEFDIRDMKTETDPVAALDMVSMLLTSGLSSKIDALLTDAKFKNLQSVYIAVFCATRGVLADEDNWSLIVQPRFPELNKRGILHTAVDIDLER